MHTIQSSDSRKFNVLYDEINKIAPIKDITTPARRSAVTIEVEEEGVASKIDLNNMSYGLQQSWHEQHRS